MKQFFIFFICCSAFISRSTIAALSGKKSQLSFTENKGQVCDQNYLMRSDVLYSGTVDNMVFHIKSAGISYQLYSVSKWKEIEIERGNEKESKKFPSQTVIDRIDVNWLNTNKSFSVKNGKSVPGFSNYYLQQCPSGVLNVRSYMEVTLINIYDNINLHYYEKNGILKYDYIVAPRADPKQIKMKIKGATIALGKNGNLILESSHGKVEEGKPLVYQNGKILNANWRVENDIISFEIQNYNPNYEMIIDPPTRAWGTYYGGSGSEEVLFADIDPSGNVCIAGNTSSATTSLVATAGAQQTFYAGGSADAFLVKFNSSGVRQWGTYYGGGGYDFGFGCSFDASGNIYMAGQVPSATGTVLATPGAHQTSLLGTSDAFLAKFDMLGVRQWCTYYGGTANDGAFQCACDPSGNVYLCGNTASSGSGIASSGAHQTSYAGGSNDAFLAKFNSSGVRQWGTYYGTTASEGAYACACDPSGNIYLGAYATSSIAATSLVTVGAHQTTYGGGTGDGLLIKFSSTGVRQWATFHGGGGGDDIHGCSTDLNGNIIITGWTNSAGGTGIASVGSHQNSFGGSNNDAYLAKFNSSGIKQWGTYYGGSGVDVGNACMTDTSGNIYLIGMSDTNSGTVIATPGAYQSNYGGGLFDAFLVKLDAGGTRQWGTYYGGSLDERCYAGAAGNSDLLYIGGYTPSTNAGVISSPLSHQSVYGGGIYDAFLVKFNQCGPNQPGSVTGLNSICGVSALVNYSVSPLANTDYYTWVLPNGWSGTSSTNVISVTSGSVGGSMSVTATNSCGTTPATILSITVNPTPTITVNSGSLCSGSILQ